MLSVGIDEGCFKRHVYLTEDVIWRPVTKTV